MDDIRFIMEKQSMDGFVEPGNGEGRLACMEKEAVIVVAQKGHPIHLMKDEFTLWCE